SLITQLDELDQLIDRASARVVAPVHLDQLRDGQVVLYPGLLEHDSDALAQLALAVGRVHAQHPDLASGARPVTLEYLDGSRLAGAVGPEQAEDLPPRYFEAHPAHSLYLAIGPAQVAHLDG